ARLPGALVPASFTFLDHLPRTPAGKLDRRALAALALAPADLSGPHVPPRTQIEELVAAIWGPLLGRDAIGAHDHFFEIGGHSLIATQVVERVRELFAVDLPLRALFEHPVLADFAGRIAAASRGGPGRPPITPVPRDAPLPASFAQWRQWFVCQLAPDRPTYHMPAALRLTGPLDAGALARGLAEIVRRHEVLRTRFELAGGRLVQVIEPEVPFAAGTIDLRDLPAGDREARVLELARASATRPFDLSRAPLLRCDLVRLGPAEHVLLFCMHHITSDGWSIEVLLRELEALYAAYAAGRASPLAELPIQYADFADWQRRWLTGPVIDEQLAYWRAALAGPPAPLELPTDRPRPAVQRHRGATLAFALPPALSAQVTAAARREGATTFMAVLTAFAALLARYAGQDDVVVGSPVANRGARELEGLIGCFVNTLALRCDLAGDPSFAEALRRVREAVIGALAHQDLPFEQLVEELQPERDPSRHPIFQAMLVFQGARAPSLALEGIEVEALPAGAGSAKFDLSLYLSESPHGLEGAVEYDTDLFEPETIARLIGHFQLLLEGCITRPERPLSAHPLLLASDRAVIERCNATQAAGPDPSCLHALVEAQVARTPGAIAVADEASRLTYRELDDRAGQLAHRLRALGVGPEARVGVCLERSTELVVALLAVLKAGGAYLPLEPGAPDERRRFMLADARPRVVVDRGGL
ncbi:MAG TPA: condensation domain-containing protein, partial [Kofleriaceae bacterium]|nr:condensation domain-containing protein [Kofleriaceae bacterium]